MEWKGMRRIMNPRDARRPHGIVGLEVQTAIWAAIEEIKQSKWGTFTKTKEKHVYGIPPTRIATSWSSRQHSWRSEPTSPSWSTVQEEPYCEVT